MGKTKTKKVHSDIVRDSINTFGANAIGAVLSLLASLLTMRRVAPGDKASYLMVQMWGGGFNTILGLSVSSAVIYFVARYTIKNAKGAVRKLTLLLGGTILLIASATVLILRNSSFFKATPSPFLIAIVVYGIMSLLFDMCSTVLRGENKFKWYNMVYLTQQILMMLLSVFIFFHPKAMLLWTWATIGITFTMICVTFYGVLRWNGPKPVPAPENDRSVKAGEMVNYGLRAHVSNVMTYVNSFLGVYLVQARYSAAAYSVYNFANTMLLQIWLLPNAVGLVILSRIASMKEQNDKVRLAVLSAKVVTYITAVTAVLLFLLSRLLLPVLFPMYAGSVEPFGYLIFGGTILSYSKVLSNSISAYGRPELNIIPTAVGIAANIALCILFAPMGVNGIAIATSLSLTMQGLTSVTIFCRFSHTKPYRLFIPSKEEITSLRGILHK